MSTLSTYKTILSRKLATASENFFDESAREQALNDATREFANDYQPIELRKKADIAIAADADSYYIGSFPSDLSKHNRITRLWVVSNKRKFTYVPPSQFYDVSGDVWTYDYNEANSAMRLYIAATDVSTLECHYIKDPPVMSADSDDSGLTAKSDELIALIAAEKLLAEARDTDALFVIRDQKDRAVRSWAGEYQMRGRRLRSKYEEVKYHART